MAQVHPTSNYLSWSSLQLSVTTFFTSRMEWKGCVQLWHYFFFIFLIEVQFIYVLSSAVQQNDSVVQDIYMCVYIHIHNSFVYLFHYGLSQDIEYGFLC